MDSITVARSVDGVRSGMVAAAAVGTAALGLWATGLVAAVPAGVGLTMVAADDLSSHRFSTRTLAGASLLVALALLVDAAVRGSWDRLAAALAGTAIVGTATAVAWLSVKGLSFGDVLLVMFAVAVPFHISGRSALVVLGSAVVLAALAVLARVARRGWSRGATVALAPALLVGWLIGVIVG